MIWGADGIWWEGGDVKYIVFEGGENYATHGFEGFRRIMFLKCIVHIYYNCEEYSTVLHFKDSRKMIFFPGRMPSGPSVCYIRKSINYKYSPIEKNLVNQCTSGTIYRKKI